MRAAFVMGGIPSLGRSGSTIAAWTILEELRRTGHDVTAVLVPAPELLDESLPARLDAFRELGAEVRVVEIPEAGPPAQGRWRARAAFARSLLAPRDDELFPAVRTRPRVHDALAGADAFLAFGIEAIAAGAGANPPGLAVVSHPPGVSRRLR